MGERVRASRHLLYTIIFDVKQYDQYGDSICCRRTIIRKSPRLYPAHPKRFYIAPIARNPSATIPANACAPSRLVWVLSALPSL